MSTCVKTFTLTTWQDAFAAHVNNIYPNSNTSALCLQHIRVFTAWHSAKFNQELNPQNLTNYDLILYRHHSLTEEKVSAATWNSRPAEDAMRAELDDERRLREWIATVPR